jgi:tetratricopeptide (TPR) repeat protein
MNLRKTENSCGPMRKKTIVIQRNKPLAQADRFHVNACSGWLGLGDVDSAIEELEQISPKKQTHPEVLMARCEVYHAAKKWTELLPIAETLLQQLPKLDFVWINRSYALHELKRTQEAFDALLPAAEQFPKRWLIRYNLGCYCSQLGRLEEAMDWLKQAMALGHKPEIKAMALSDSDFEPLWKAIREI